MPGAREPPVIRTELVVSKQFACLLCAGHLGALAISAALSVSTPWLIPLCAAVVLSWLWALERHVLLRSARSFIALELKGERSCALQIRTGEWIRGELQATSYVLPWLIILHVAVDGRLFDPRVALFADSMMRESHRRLRVRLRWARYGKAAEARSDAPL